MEKLQNAKQKQDWRPVLLRLPWLLLLPLGLLLPQLCAGRQQAMERYAQTLYPAIKDALCAVTSRLPFSLAEALLYALCIGVPLLLVSRLILLCLRRITLARFTQIVLSLLIAAGVALNLFYVTWGFNYFRAPLPERMGLSLRERPVEELGDFTAALAKAASALRETLPEDEAGVFTVADSAPAALFPELVDAYGALAKEYPVFSGRVTPAKSVEWSEGLSWLGISGIYIGLTAEPNVNTHQPPLLMLHGAAHEMAHQLGIASEDAAELAGFLACLYADRPEIVYSGLVNALIHCGNALYRADAAQYALAYRQYSDALVRDLAAYRLYWQRYEVRAEEIASQANDGYLKHNAQQSGIKSYGESVDLLLALQESKNILAKINYF